MWITAAILSSVSAGLSAILSKCGLKHANADAATAVRTTVVLLLTWGIVFGTGSSSAILSIGARSWIFLLLSGIATGMSWICFFKALSLGEVSKVAAVDKSSAVLTILCAVALFPDERARWWLKLLFLLPISAGIFLMTEWKRGERAENRTWFFFAALSAIFAAATSILTKIGVENVDSNAATAIRTSVVFVLAWLIVIFRGEAKFVREFRGKDFLFLLLSGVATGASWLCYFYAVQKGQVSVVVPIDKMSIAVTVLFSCLVFREKLSVRAWIGLLLLTAGTVGMAIFT